MKKICSILLVLTLVLASCSVAFAAPVEITNDQLSDGSEAVTNDVIIDITEVTGGGNIYNVDVEWGNLTFKYDFGSNATWDPDNHILSEPVAAKWIGDTTSKITALRNLLCAESR